MNPTLLANLMIVLAGWALMNKLGLISSAEDTKSEEQFKADSTFAPFSIMFDPQFIFDYFNKLKQPKKDQLWNKYTAKAGVYENMCKQILGAKNLLNDDENAVFAAFKNISSESELAWFTWKFFEYWENNPVEITAYYLETNWNNKILGNFLASFLDAEDLTKLKNQLKKLKHE